MRSKRVSTAEKFHVVHLLQADARTNRRDSARLSVHARRQRSEFSENLSNDRFSAFDRDHLFDPEVAIRYRDRILMQGGRRDAADLVEDFLGRPFGFESFADWLAEPAGTEPARSPSEGEG